MKPFNLEEALAGKPVVTRDGRKVTIVKEYRGTIEHPIGAIAHDPIGAGDRFYDYYEDGSYANCETKHDLFMATKTITRWFNIYPNTGACHSSKEEADKCAIPNRVACVKVEYEE